MTVTTAHARLNPNAPCRVKSHSGAELLAAAQSARRWHAILPAGLRAASLPLPLQLSQGGIRGHAHSTS
jgi:hypothetical protein